MNECVKLREGVCRHLKEREWFFSRLENGTVSLVHHSIGMGVRSEDNDWSKVSLPVVLSRPAGNTSKAL